MNHQLQHKKMNAEPIKCDLLRELKNETRTARRQELLKAIWRLDRQSNQPISPQSLRPPMASTVKPESEAKHRNPRIVQEPDRRPKDRTDSPIATVTHQKAENRGGRIMSDKETLAALNELYATERFSLANYLRYAVPWVAAADQSLAEAIRRVSDRQLDFVERIGALVIERRGHIEGGSFPLRFTAFNDLSLAYLAPRVMDDQERIVRQVSEIARQICTDAVACGLVNEILRAERAHLDNLRELLGGQKDEPCHKSAVAALGEGRCREHTVSVATAV